MPTLGEVLQEVAKARTAAFTSSNPDHTTASHCKKSKVTSDVFLVLKGTVEKNSAGDNVDTKATSR